MSQTYYWLSSNTISSRPRLLPYATQENVLHWGKTGLGARQAAKSHFDPIVTWRAFASICGGLNYAYRGIGVGHAIETKTSTRKQISIFLSGTLVSREQYKHIQIRQRCFASAVALCNYPLDEDYPSFRSERSRTVRENQYALVVVPIVNDIFENEYIGLRY
jgi:hypothetical protein